jgi:NAD(P)H dehydrogenase (quinone)|tara:strand:- start:1578 stop:2156 length:579 start_codon:yes stop_codon:yes gene_type:complete
MKKILIVYYSQNGAIEKMSEKISRGINSVENSEAIIRTLPDLKDHNAGTIANKNNILYATNDDLENCDGLILGSPTYFGNMAAPMKFFLDGTSAEWFNSTLSGKPAGVFTSSSSMHGGQETTLITMMIPLLHHGMIISGIPYSEKELHDTRTGGSPYGPTHFAGNDVNGLSDHEIKLCKSFGSRIANLAKKL